MKALFFCREWARKGANYDIGTDAGCKIPDVKHYFYVS